ncbi:response regulator [Candidatus Accumulibacter vicinus]|uniref:histidine kinase n=1 Tax=Candidatus Accumulibacter vicinus TaxID=2954382 RepID=A0A084Y216_9PROT|nr:response regulator [Candidatus Accumulibacter vicinus]KFB68760.1 MAG: Autoinducer 2 sensor kinase/phosphatase LuxQ [Candidatus Accumulibacter vicinus]
MLHFLNQFTIRQKILGLIFVALLGAASTGFEGMRGTATMSELADRMYTDQLQPIAWVAVANQNAIYVNRADYRLAVETEAARLREAAGNRERFEKEMMRLLDLYRRADLTPAEADAMKRFDAAWRAMNTVCQKIGDLARGGVERDLKPALDLMAGECRPKFQVADDILSEIVEINLARSEQAIKGLRQQGNDVRDVEIAVLAVTGALLLILGMAVLRSTLRQLGGEPARVRDVMKRLSNGDLSTLLPIEPGDTESMACSINTMIGTLSRLAVRAEAIGRGDFSEDVPLLSENDQLGQAIDNMNRMLRATKLADAGRNWVKDGYNHLSTELTGGLSLQQLADTAIRVVGRYLAAGRGVLYVFRPQENCLELLASYMYTQRSRLGNRFAVGEGAVGQVARERKPIILTAVDPDGAPVVTGTLSALPCYTYTYPLLREDVLLGVVELASFERFDELQCEFLLGATGIVASFLHAAEQQENVRRLLVVAENAEKEARQQSERLQEANARMEEQQQQLQQQAEELRQSNVQLEEQQQQVQQQSEELEQTNSQLEQQQKQLEQSNFELRRSREELDARAQQLELSSQYKSEFLANMSHELRTPLNAIILLSKMIAGNAGGRLNNDEVKQAEVIHRAGEDLLHLINDVLDLSKVEAGHMELHPALVDSAALSASCRDLFEHAARERGLTFDVADHIQGGFVSDVDKIGQILRNLLSNALKFTKKGGVSLRLERRSGDALPIRIDVRDTGIGIPPDKQALIFEAFRQADGSTSRQYGGTGLGLTISLRLAQLLGGTIELASTLGEGSVFSLRLPEDPTNQPLAAAAPPPAPPPTVAEERVIAPLDDREHLAPGDQVILLIDDDLAFGNALRQLNRKLGYKTLLAANGADGIELARRHRPAGILLDLGLPDMDGSEVLHAIKSSDLAPIPVYVVSARDRDAALLRQGIVGYLQKPVNADQLARVENEVIAARAAVLVVGSSGIDAAEVLRIIGPRFGQVRQCAAGEALRAALREHRWRLALVVLRERGADEGVTIAESIRQASPETAILFFSPQPVSEADEARLRVYSDSIIVNTPQADQRLLRNVERFLLEVPQAAPSTTVEDGHQRLAGRSILVVDDDPRNLFVITAALEQNGASVRSAVNGKQALALLAQAAVDLVITDIMMPEMDGYQTIAAIRGTPGLASIPIVALTAKALPEDKKSVLAAGADDYLSKPVDYEVLVNMAALWCAKR